MKKLGLLLCATGTLILAACSTTAAQIKDLPERDARIIVEVDKNINKLSEKGAKMTQYAVYNNIKAAATSNIRMVGNYTVLNNAFVLEVNSNDIESIKSVPGVKSVTRDTMHWVREINQDGYIPLGDVGGGEGAIDESKNISAETMNMPEDNNEGEGTLVAILDNEFHLRGYTGNYDDRDHGEAWHHEVYTPLADDVAVRYTYESMTATIDEINASEEPLKAGARKEGKTAGQEGSMYYNNKVPFYYDYGGYSKIYGKRGAMKYDVHSDLSYHGSHVSSITAANAPDYKGIAPKAQLALMKVFTDYDAKGLGEKLGLSTHTGAYDTSILDALEDCIKLKVDGINMSLGSDLNDFDSESITLKTLTKLKSEHILTSISAGNSGKTSYASSGAYANWMPEMVETGILSGYANNVDSMTIASGHPTKIFYENAFRIGNSNIAFEDQIVNKEGFDDDYEEEIRMKQIFPNPDSELEWVYIPGFGTSGDYDGIEARNKVVVVNRGSTSFADKYATAVSKKAKGIVIINNDPTASSFNFRCSFGDGFNPTIPCVLVLYKDKAFFEQQRSGSFSLINKQVSDNPAKYTTSTFSTDGATFDLDLKPEITAPGDNIRGAVPEHAMTNIKKSDWFLPENKNKCYQYLSGTSMSAPNFAGAQAVMASEVAAPIYQAAKAANRDITPAEQAQIDAYKDTINMRLMSTANPMNDYVANPEDNKRTLTSPRIQGAGMADLGGALRTDVYLEGLDLNGNKTAKAKIALRYSEDIAKGDIKLSFLAHNESDQARNYNVTLTVMRPAIAHPNDIVTKEYTFKGTVEKIENFSGMKYYDPQLKRMDTAAGDVSFKDAIYAGKDIEYYASADDYKFDQENKAAIAAGTLQSKKTIIAKGYYYNSSTDSVSWDPLPSYTAQSTMDVEIAKITSQTVTVNPGENTINIAPYSLTEEEKNKILDVYEYGCMIEGYVTLTSTDGHEDLSIPYLGFYAGADRNPDASYEKAPVAEPFNFEKDPTKVYPSYLANDIAAALVGKDQANMESMIVAGYAESPASINTDKILTNDLAFNDLEGFKFVGTDPTTGEYFDNAKDNIYVGGSKTNTMIIQQFILRSVKENFFTITNKETGKAVYTSALSDTLSGDTADRWALWKSHVDYLGGGYVSHRALAIVPLYDETTGERFPSGEYELTFNYQLAATNNWVSKSYNIKIDSEAPVVSSIAQYRKDGVNRVRIYLEENYKLSYAVLGYNYVDVNFDSANNKYYIDETKAFVDECIEELSEGLQSKRLYVGAGDYARGETGAIVHMNNEKSFAAGYTIVQGEGVDVKYDFTVSADNKVSFFDTLDNNNPVTVAGDIRLAKYAATGEPIYEDPKPTEPTQEVEIPDSSAPVSSEPASSNPGESSSEPAAPAKKGCNGALAAVSAIVAIPALMGTALLFLKKRKEGGK